MADNAIRNANSARLAYAANRGTGLAVTDSVVGSVAMANNALNSQSRNYGRSAATIAAERNRNAAKRDAVTKRTRSVTASPNTYVSNGVTIRTERDGSISVEGPIKAKAVKTGLQYVYDPKLGRVTLR